MKARHEFTTDAEYKDYLTTWYAGLLTAAASTGKWKLSCFEAVRQARELTIEVMSMYPPSH